MASIRANPNQIALCDMAIYGMTIDPADKEWRTQPRVNTQIFCFIETCEDIGFFDDDLFAEFKSTFQGWDADLFKKSSQPIRTKLKAFLKDNGVYVSNTASVSDQMQELLSYDECPEWPENALTVHKATKGRFRFTIHEDSYL